MQSETTAFFLLFGILSIYMRVTLNVQRLCNVIFSYKIIVLYLLHRGNLKD